jgi:hypothetical protein
MSVTSLVRKCKTRDEYKLVAFHYDSHSIISILIIKVYSVAQWVEALGLNQKVMGSTSDYVFDVFHCLNSSGSTMALGSSLVEGGEGEGGRCLGLTTFISWLKSWETETPGALRAYLGLYRVALPLLVIKINLLEAIEQFNNYMSVVRACC